MRRSNVCKTRFAAVLIASSLFGASGLHAEWIHQAGEDDPFKGGAEHIVTAVELPGVMMGVRCTSPVDLVLMFVPLEKADPALAATLKLKARFHLLIIIDDQPKVSIPATLEITPDGERYRIETNGPTAVALIPIMARAKRRVAMAAEINGKLAWSQSFSANGSRRALDPLIGACKIEEKQ